MGHVVESALILLVVLIFCNFCSNDQQIRFTVYENAAVGTLIGNLNGNNDRKSSGSPVTFLLVHPPENQIDQTFDIDQTSGEIRTKKLLDYEMKKSYIFLAIPTDGSSIAKRISIDILDINDNRPEFLVKTAEIQLSESLKLNSEISLTPAVDLDDGVYGIHNYEIVSGNINQTFDLAYDKDSSSLNSYLNLILNFELDREIVDRYELLVRCYDGGQPSLTDDMLVKISVLDANDNAPIFEKNEYRAEFSGIIGQEILKIKATDRDIGVNGQILYSLVENHDFVRNFHINKHDGSLSLKNALSIDSIESFDIIVAAKDQGSPSLQSTASVELLKQKFDLKSLNIKFRNFTVPEDISPGKAITCFEVDLPLGSYNLSLINAEKKFNLKSSTAKSYCIVTNSSFDREQKAAYHPKIIIIDFGANQTYTSSFDLKISDVNDNEPRFTSPEYETNLQENSAPGTSVFKMMAADPDEGLNGRIFYSIENAGADPGVDLFDIDPNSGLICIKNNYSNNGAITINCDVNSKIELRIKARDMGTPPKFSVSKLSVNMLSVNDNAPIFDRPIYNVTIKEDAAVGTCFLQV
uniref:Cadherin domain-containing protein n=1 Tax=Romanomermis culicivorax TaxID=13658 RepID=A0A915J6Q8_ROMCU